MSLAGKLAPTAALVAGCAFLPSPGNAAGAYDGVYLGEIACSAIGSAAGFTQTFRLVVRDGRYVHEQGTPGAEGWVRWEARIGDDGAVTVTGRYVAGEEKPIAYAATIVDRRLRGEGTRGPRRCVLEAASPPTSGATMPFKAVPDAALRQALVGRARAGFECKEPPAPVRDLAAGPFYAAGDPTHSKIDPEALERYNAEMRPLRAFEREIASLGDLYLSTAPRDGRIAACLAHWLDRWASAGALLGKIAHTQGTYERKWSLATYALNYALFADAPEVAADVRRRIEAWLADLAWAMVPRYVQGGRPDVFSDAFNNHLNWAALAALATAVAVQDRALFDWGIDRARVAIGQIQADGTLRHELVRAARATHYHRFALEPLILTAEIAAANGIDLYGERDGALHRLAAITRAALLDPEIMARRTGVAQATDGADRLNPSMFAWAEPYGARFRDGAILDVLRRMRGDGIGQTWLGGNLTLRFGLKEP